MKITVNQHYIPRFYMKYFGNIKNMGTKKEKALISFYQFKDTEILRQYFINHPQSIDKYTFLQNSAFTHWVKEKCSKMC